MGEMFRWELEGLRAAGLTPEQVIDTLTRNAATYLGRQDDLGTIEANKLADLLIVEGNPLADLSALQNVVVVIKDGRIVVDRRSD